MRILPVNLASLLVELDDLGQALGLYERLRQAPIAGVTHLIPAARTLLVTFAPARIDADTLARRLLEQPLTNADHHHGERIEIPVYYDGEDLDDVARLLDMTTDELIRRHGEHDYRVAFCGFAPGFAYLSGGAGFDVPRRPSPRTRIPAGSVALAGAFGGVYPTASPGGWQLIGTTPLDMWDTGRTPPALLQPGMRVRFTATDTPPQRTSVPAPRPDAIASRPATLEVLTPGLQSLYQDLGRPGQTAQGVSTAGAMDRGAFRAANRLVGNPTDAATLEVALGGLQLRCHRPALVGVTGAHLALSIRSEAGETLTPSVGRPIELAPGDTLTLGAPSAGLRSYLALRGGFDVPPVLGSRSTDTLAKLGPTPLERGDPLCSSDLPSTALSLEEDAAFALPRAGQTITLDVVMGPRSDWFTAQGQETLCSQDWRVTGRSDRVGLRLAGEHPLERTDSAELPSEGTVTGAIQVPADGQPVLFLADHPLTGGYPVIACVADYHLDLAGQIPANASLRFNPISAFEPLGGDDTRGPNSLETST
ncbi:5-oxoprolinase/urea amidolyase family protein [Halomonas borealis]|uniref:5-oxoprolinase subunit B/C family protein n=1 Tax=Halomonas borealis TaxID=2508710 RepID=UPI0010A0030A|nr:5-oxoprolinase/urea amidolyase family protein [Halomonas borealis]